MKRVTIDGNYICSKDQIHGILARELAFPSWYGNNLDALYDCLTDLRAPVEIRVCNEAAMEITVPGYAARLTCVLLDAAEENDNLTVIRG